MAIPEHVERALYLPIRATGLRLPDTRQGVVWVAEDFDAPLPDDLLDAFEGRP